MIQIRKANERGHADHGWLNTYHTFSFADYYDPNHHQFRSLRVINEDFIAPAQGFPTHSHQNMEIISYVVSGALEHKDSMGNGSVIVPGEIQYMSAGSGVTHSEFNYSKNEQTHLLQIWILPAERNTKPTYDQRNFLDTEKPNQLNLIVSGTGENNSIKILQDVKVFAATLEKNKKINYPISNNRHVWIQLIKGKLQVNEGNLSAGDGVAISEEKNIPLQTNDQNAEFLLFDLN